VLLSPKKKVWYLTRLGEGDATYVLETFPVVIGSGENCDWILEHFSVSEAHAQINKGDDGLLLCDLESTNGTYVSDHRVNTVPILAKGKFPLTIRFGAVMCELGLGKPPAEKPKSNETEEDPWFYERDGREYGPFTVAQFFEAVDAGQLRPDDQVWQSSDDFRVDAYKVQGLFDNLQPPTEHTVELEEVPTPSMGSHGHGTVTCPYCWYHFNPEEALFIATHPELIGDLVLGQDDAQRFLPDRFTPEGLALDAKGMRCPDVACPRCHLRLPALALSCPPLFLSIVGAPASGKSYFLASSIWKLRTVLPSIFGQAFSDADAQVNQWLNDYEERIFFHSGSSRIQPIVKTDETAPHVYREVQLDEMRIFLPLPCMFSMSPIAASTSGKNDAARCLVLYDNAGEHFQVGHDSILRPGTQHLVHSESLVFLFDPLADPRFRSFLEQEASVAPGQASAVHRQDVILVEMISRIRKHLGLTGGELYEKPLVLCLSKADVFGELIQVQEDPWLYDDEAGGHALDLCAIAEASYLVRQLLLQYAPEVVTTVESFARRVVYMPISSLGHNPTEEGVDASKIQARWVEVPMLYVLAKTGHIPSLGPSDHKSDVDVEVDRRGHILRFRSPETGTMHEVPWHYSGYELPCTRSGKRFRVPHVDQAPSI